jgi:hypothetical protein
MGISNKPLTLSVPYAIRQNARLGLQLRRKFNRGNKASYIAQKLITGNIDIDTLQKILLYFKNHVDDAKKKTVKGEWNTATNPNDLYVDWLMHGGSKGLEYFMELIKNNHAILPR